MAAEKDIQMATQFPAMIDFTPKMYKHVLTNFTFFFTKVSEAFYQLQLSHQTTNRSSRKALCSFNFSCFSDSANSDVLAKTKLMLIHFLGEEIIRKSDTNI